MYNGIFLLNKYLGHEREKIMRFIRVYKDHMVIGRDARKSKLQFIEFRI